MLVPVPSFAGGGAVPGGIIIALNVGPPGGGTMPKGPTNDRDSC